MEIKRKLTLNRVKRRKKARVLAGDYAVLGFLIAIVCIWCACVVKYERDLENAMGIGDEPRYISIRSATTTETEVQVQQSEQTTEEYAVALAMIETEGVKHRRPEGQCNSIPVTIFENIFRKIILV